MIEVIIFAILGIIFLVIPIAFGKGYANKFTGVFVLVIIFMWSNIYYKTIYNKTIMEKIYEISRQYND